MRVPFSQMKGQFERVLLKKGFNRELAELNARLFAENSLDGVYTHGLNRFPRTVEYIDNGWIAVNAVPEKLGGFGAFEQWEGNLGIGPSNAWRCMERAVELARQYGIGAVAVRNTTHWMRGGAYGLQAADRGCIGICFTNTMPNMPPWGSSENRVGNNPFIIAIPREGGHVMLDMAMSQYSFGAIEKYAREDKTLPVPGGYDTKGEITCAAAEIWQTQRPLPIGFWKGSGMSVVLDLLASVLAQGNSVADIAKLPAETSVSQFFLAMDAQKLAGDGMAAKIEETLAFIKGAEKLEGVNEILFPNERAHATRHENLEKGIPVDEDYWSRVQSY